ncbi:hypothetical protein GOP47_0026026 [Adiantum capillus-veneris]|uniref:TFIIS N-terminal domain-containing protein n=1 Tax=Adiantum capillus-veneris TaxID=13818 RepID=A0A9D4Z439_ADICA|nr:hypothetical protein GOP47_0026026 [Adiantum capillus-veneris]
MKVQMASFQYPSLDVMRAEMLDMKARLQELRAFGAEGEDEDEATLMERLLEEMMGVMVARTQEQHVLPLLQESQLGKLMNGLRKHAAPRVAALAENIVAAWKDSIIRHQSSAKYVDKKPAQKVKHEESMKIEEQPAMQTRADTPPKPDKNRVGAPKLAGTERATLSSSMTFEEKLDASKRKLHTAYAQEQAAKRQHTIRVLAPSQLPSMGANSGRRPALPSKQALSHRVLIAKRLNTLEHAGRARNCAYAAPRPVHAPTRAIIL